MPSAYKDCEAWSINRRYARPRRRDFRKRVKVRFIIRGCQLLCLKSPCSGISPLHREENGTAEIFCTPSSYAVENSLSLGVRAVG